MGRTKKGTRGRPSRASKAKAEKRRAYAERKQRKVEKTGRRRRRMASSATSTSRAKEGQAEQKREKQGRQQHKQRKERNQYTPRNQHRRQNAAHSEKLTAMKTQHRGGCNSTAVRAMTLAVAHPSRHDKQWGHYRLGRRINKQKY